MLVGMLPAMASADEVGEDLAPPAPQEENYGYVRLVFAEGEQLDLCHGEYITECSPTAAVYDGADEDFLTDGDYLALYYEGKLYHKAALDGVSIDAGAVLPAEDFALVPMGKLAAQEPPSGAEPEAPTTGGTTEGTTEGTTGGTTEGTNGGTTQGTTGGTNGGTNEGTTKKTTGEQQLQQETLPTPTLVRKAPQRAAEEYPYGRVQIKFADMDSKDENRIFLEDRQFITVCQKNATVYAVEGDEHAGRNFVTNGNYIAYFYLGRLYLKGDFNGAFIDMQQVKPYGPKNHVYVTVQDNTTMSGKPCLLYANYRHIILEIPTGKTLTLNANHDTDIMYPGAIYTHYDTNGVTIRGGGTLNINYEGRKGSTERWKAVYGICASKVTLERSDDSRYLGSPTVNINMNNGGSDFNGDAVMGIDANVLTVKDKARLNIKVTGRALDPTKEGISYAEGATQGRVNMAIRADSMELLDDASVDITSHANVISDIYLTGSGEVLKVNTTGHLNIKNEGNIERYPKEDDGVDTRDLPDGNIKVPTGASVKFEKAQEGIFIDSYSKQINKWYDDDIAGNGDPTDHWAIGGSLVLVDGMYRGDHRVGDWEKVTGNNFDIIWGSAKFIYSTQGVHTVKVSRGIGMAQNDASNNPTGRVKEPEFNDIYIVKQGDWLELTAPEGKGKFLYWYDATSDDNTEGGTTWTNQTLRFNYLEKDMLLVPVYDVMTKEPTLGSLRYAEGGKIFSNYSSHDLDFAYDGADIDDNHGFRVYLVPARLPKVGEVMQHVTMLDGRTCVSFKPGTLFADANHPSAGAAYNYMSIKPGKYRIAVGDWDGGHGNWYFSEPFDFSPPVAPPYVTPKSTFFQEAGSQQVTITAERNAAIQYRLWDYDTNAWSNYRDYTGPFTVSYTADQDARIEARATGSAAGVTTKVEYAVNPTAIPTVKYGDRVLADAGSPYASERYYYQSMELQVEPLEGYDIYYRVGYEPDGGSNGSEIRGTKLEEDGKVTISGTGTEQEYVYFRARKSLPGREGEWSRTSARLTLKEVTALPVPNVTFYDGDTKVTPDSNNTVFFHERLTAVLSETTYWPINAEMRYSKSKVGRSEAYTVPVEYTSEGHLRVSAAATLADGSSASDSFNSVLYTIQQDASHVKKEVSTGSTIKLFNPPTSSQPLQADSIIDSAWKYNINVGAQIKVLAPSKQNGLPFYKWKADPDVVVFSDPHSYLTTFTMPDKDFTLTAEYQALPTTGITRDTYIILDADKPAGKSLSLSQLANGAFSEWRHLTYQWYEGNTASGTPLNSFDSFETGKTYTARVTITVTEGCTFANESGVRTKTDPSSGNIGVDEDKLTRATDKKSIAFDLHLLTKPELTIELAPGDPLPTAADLTDQLPEGYTVKTLTWQDGATTAPDSATVTISKLEIRPVEGSYQLANRSVWINGTEYTGTYSGSTLTLTNINLPVKPKGVTVSGTAVSWNNTDNAVYLLYDSSVSDTDIKADMKLASPEKALAYTAVKGGITANADGKRYNQTFSFSTVPDGTYKLAIYKPGKYVPKIITVNVDSSDIALGEVKLWLYGDVNYDGKVNGTDAAQIQRFYASKIPNALATGSEQDIADKKLCADVNRDGKINGTDAVQIQRYYANKTPNAFTSIE